MMYEISIQKLDISNLNHQQIIFSFKSHNSYEFFFGQIRFYSQLHKQMID